MNARQKAKKYKKQIEFLKNMTIHPTIHVLHEDLGHYRFRSALDIHEMNLIKTFDNPNTFIRSQHIYKIHQDIENLITPDMLEYKDGGRCAEFEMWIRRKSNDTNK